MKKMKWSLILVALASIFVLAACAAKADTDSEEKPVPAPYAGMKNPVEGKTDAADAGKLIYTDNCLTCHGESGKGDGPGGTSLKIKPADLTEVAANDDDDRIFWIVSEGGVPAGKSEDMKPWKDTLSQDEIWQVITYMRTIKQK
jgi:mono/diheme cytochrome c family protein